MATLELPPVQIVLPPAIAAVGTVFTTTKAVPLPTPVQLASAMAVIEYVLVDTGFTLNEYGLDTILVIEVEVVPSK